MNDQLKNVLKKNLRNAETKPVLRRLKPLTDNYLRVQGIKEEAEKLAGCTDPVVLFGVNRLSLQFYEELVSKKVETYLVALDDETIPAKYTAALMPSEALMPSADLIYLKERKPRIYSMSASRDGMVKSRVLELGLRPQNVKRLGYGTIARIRGVRLADSRDPLLGSVRTHDSELPGYTIFQTEDTKNALRILVLGGSTSDPTLMNLKSWSEYLFEALKNMGIPTILFNGAVGGYTSSQELKKLIRDITILRPQLIISLSGVNDAAGIYMEPSHPLYQREDRAETEWLVKEKKARNGLQYDIPLTGVNLGPEDSRSLFQVWLDNERCMHAIAEEFGADFHAFLQPVKEVSSIKTDFYRDAKTYFSKKHPEWMHNFTHLFEKNKTVFADHCHVYEKGNRMISRELLSYVLSYLDTMNFKS